MKKIFNKEYIKKNFYSYLFLLPWLIFLFVFTLFPFIYGFVISLFDYSFKNQTFVGLQNYFALFNSEDFINSIIVTFKFVAIIIPGTLVISLGVAYAIQNLSEKIQTIIKIIFYLTSIVSQVALVMVWKWMFNPNYGLYASICNILNIPTVDLLGNPVYSLPLLSVLVLSFTISQPIILFSSAMDAVPVAYYEAAALDGISKSKVFRKITLPMISPTIIFVLITTTINNLQVFVVPQLMTNGGPNGATTPILLLIYRSAFEYGNFGYASAMGIVLFAIIAVFVFIQFKITNKEEI